MYQLLALLQILAMMWLIAEVLVFHLLGAEIL